MVQNNKDTAKNKRKNTTYTHFLNENNNESQIYPTKDHFPARNYNSIVPQKKQAQQKTEPRECLKQIPLEEARKPP